MWGSVSIDRELIGRLIGPKGASIQALEASTGARLAIFDEAGIVQVCTVDELLRVLLCNLHSMLYITFYVCDTGCHRNDRNENILACQVFAPTAEQFQAAEQAVLAVSGGNLTVRV